MKKYMVTIGYRSGREFSIALDDTPEFIISRMKECMDTGANTIVINDTIIFLDKVEQMHFQEMTPAMARYQDIEYGRAKDL